MVVRVTGPVNPKAVENIWIRFIIKCLIEEGKLPKEPTGKTA